MSWKLIWGAQKEGEMKNHVITAIVVALLVGLVIPTGCAQPAEFEVSSLNISPPEVVEGELQDMV
jgi:fumarate reductase subunit D